MHVLLQPVCRVMPTLRHLHMLRQDLWGTGSAFSIIWLIVLPLQVALYDAQLATCAALRKGIQPSQACSTARALTRL